MADARPSGGAALRFSDNAVIVRREGVWHARIRAEPLSCRLTRAMRSGRVHTKGRLRAMPLSKVSWTCCEGEQKEMGGKH